MPNRFPPLRPQHELSPPPPKPWPIVFLVLAATFVGMFLGSVLYWEVIHVHNADRLEQELKEISK